MSTATPGVVTQRRLPRGALSSVIFCGSITSARIADLTRVNFASAGAELCSESAGHEAGSLWASSLSQNTDTQPYWE